MSIQIEQGKIVLYFTNMVFLHTVNQWKREADEPFSFDIVNVYVDRDQYLERYDIGVIFFGFGLSLKINYFDESKQMSPSEKETMKKNIHEQINI